jgi:hypothetical protein
MKQYLALQYTSDISNNDTKVILYSYEPELNVPKNVLCTYKILNIQGNIFNIFIKLLTDRRQSLHITCILIEHPVYGI